MGSMNRWQGIGNLGRDAELRYTPGGQAVATFSMACTETWNDKQGQKQEKTEWVRCVLWGKPAESLSEFLTKGKQIYAEGRMQTRKWEDKDGVEKYTTEINVQRVVLLGGGQGGGAQRSAGRGRGSRDEYDQARPEAPQQPAAGYQIDDNEPERAQPISELTDDEIPF
jgi:single-strand DNA-binding protein